MRPGDKGDALPAACLDFISFFFSLFRRGAAIMRCALQWECCGWGANEWMEKRILLGRVSCVCMRGGDGGWEFLFRMIDGSSSRGWIFARQCCTFGNVAGGIFVGMCVGLGSEWLRLGRTF